MTAWEALQTVWIFVLVVFCYGLSRRINRLESEQKSKRKEGKD